MSKTAFDPDATQSIKAPPTKIGVATKAADAFLQNPRQQEKPSNAKLLMGPGGASAVMKANALSPKAPRKISPASKIAAPESPLKGLPKETLGGAPNLARHKGFYQDQTFARKTPEAEPMHKQAPPSLGNQNVRPRERKRIGEGSIINRLVPKMHGVVNRAIGRKDVPIRRTSPHQVDPANKETPAMWRRQDALSKSQEMPRVKADASKVPEPTPSPAPAVVPTPETPKPAEPPTPGPGSSAPIARGSAPAAKLAQGEHPLNRPKPKPRSTGAGASSDKPVAGEPVEHPYKAMVAGEPATAKDNSKKIAARVADVHKGLMVTGHYAAKGAKQVFNAINGMTKIKR